VNKKGFLSFWVLGIVLIFVLSSTYLYYFTIVETDLLFPGHKYDDPDDVEHVFFAKQSPAGVITNPFSLSLFFEDNFCKIFSGFFLLTPLIHSPSSILRC
jgi:hypothetical protein